MLAKYGAAVDIRDKVTIVIVGICVVEDIRQWHHLVLSRIFLPGEITYVNFAMHCCFNT